MPAFLQAQRSNQVGYRRSGQRPYQVYIDTRGDKPGFQRGLQHVPGDARILANQDSRPALGAMRLAQDRPGGLAQPQYKIGRYRMLADLAANAVGPEVSFFHAHVREAQARKAPEE